MATAPCSSSPDTSSSFQHEFYRSLKTNIARHSFLYNTIPIPDPLFLEPHNSENQRSTSSPEDSQSFNTNQAENNIVTRIKNGKKPGRLPLTVSPNPDRGVTPRSRNRPVTAQLSLGHGRNSTSMGDRFIPSRSYSGNAMSRYRMRKLPLELTAEEKLLRRRERSEDPFARRRNRRKILPAISLYTPDITQGPHMSPHIVDHRVVSSYFPHLGRRIAPRQVSVGAVWNVGGASVATRGPWLGVTDGQKGYSGSKATAPMYFARFEPSKEISASEELEMTQARLAAAFDMDLTHRQLAICKPAALTEDRLCRYSPRSDNLHPLKWKDCAWRRAEAVPYIRGTQDQNTRTAVADPIPFCIIPSHYIRDDFYRSAIAFCCTSGILAFGMGRSICLWSMSKCKMKGVCPLGYPREDEAASLAFSSADGRRSILAVATSCGYLHLWDTLKCRPWRPSCRYRDPIDCVAFKATATRRTSVVIPSIEVSVEHLAVGDRRGIIWYYSLEISHLEALSRMTLLARIDAHCQRVCCISWSPDYRYLATSGDDNVCLLFDLNRILHNEEIPTSAMSSSSITNRIVPAPQARPNTILGPWLARVYGRRLSRVIGEYSLSRPRPSTDAISDTSSISAESVNQQATRTYPRVRNNLPNSSRPANTPRSQPPRRVVSVDYSSGLRHLESATYLPYGNHMHQFEHGSAVKAVAFAPWQPTLLATGGGMEDRTVHFYHAPTGSCLAKIYMWGQITGLIWSKTRREIAVVLGFPEGEHHFRVVVFAWPSCKQITAIPWNLTLDGQTLPDMYAVPRALSAVSIPNFKSPLFEEEDGSFNPEDECIAVSSSDFIRFYRIWRKPHKRLTGSIGVMNSAILESIDGIENPGNEIIR